MGFLFDSFVSCLLRCLCCRRSSDPLGGFQADLATLECVTSSFPVFTCHPTEHRASSTRTPLTNLGSDRTPRDTNAHRYACIYNHTGLANNIIFLHIIWGESWHQFGGILTWNRSHPVTSRQLWKIPCILMPPYLIFISAMPCWQLVPDPMDQWGLFLAPLSDTDADV